jgi:hypothetical protein
LKICIFPPLSPPKIVILCWSIYFNIFKNFDGKRVHENAFFKALFARIKLSYNLVANKIRIVTELSPLILFPNSESLVIRTWENWSEQSVELYIQNSCYFIIALPPWPTKVYITLDSFFFELSHIFIVLSELPNFTILNLILWTFSRIWIHELYSLFLLCDRSWLEIFLFHALHMLKDSFFKSYFTFFSNLFYINCIISPLLNPSVIS